MAHWQRKRKHQARFSHPHNITTTFFDQTEAPPDPALFLEAHEADIIRGPQVQGAARSLEYIGEGPGGKAYIGDSLIEWTRREEFGHAVEKDEETIRLHLSTASETVDSTGVDESNAVWVDRYANFPTFVATLAMCTVHFATPYALRSD